MRKILFVAIVFCVFSLVSCDKRPDYVLPEEQMTDIITDLQLNDAACQVKQIQAVYNPNAYTHYYNQIFEKYNVTPEIFDSSMVWYTKNKVDALRKIYKNVDATIDKMQEEYNDKE